MERERIPCLGFTSRIKLESNYDYLQDRKVILIEKKTSFQVMFQLSHMKMLYFCMSTKVEDWFLDSEKMVVVLFGFVFNINNKEKQIEETEMWWLSSSKPGRESMVDLASWELWGAGHKMAVARWNEEGTRSGIKKNIYWQCSVTNKIVIFYSVNNNDTFYKISCCILVKGKMTQLFLPWIRNN